MKYLTANTITEPMDGWLDKDGCFFPCGELHHVETAEKIAESRYRRVVNGDRFLECLGYARITGFGQVHAAELTDAQVNFLYAMIAATTDEYSQFKQNIRKSIK